MRIKNGRRSISARGAAEVPKKLLLGAIVQVSSGRKRFVLSLLKRKTYTIHPIFGCFLKTGSCGFMREIFRIKLLFLFP